MAIVDTEGCEPRVFLRNTHAPTGDSPPRYPPREYPSKGIPHLVACPSRCRYYSRGFCAIAVWVKAFAFLYQNTCEIKKIYRVYAKSGK